MKTKRKMERNKRLIMHNLTVKKNPSQTLKQENEKVFE